jgi:hypothetical protein
MKFIASDIDEFANSVNSKLSSSKSESVKIIQEMRSSKNQIGLILEMPNKKSMFASFIEQRNNESSTSSDDDDEQ